jgi:hypothetical protein
MATIRVITNYRTPHNLTKGKSKLITHPLLEGGLIIYTKRKAHIYRPFLIVGGVHSYIINLIQTAGVHV